MVGVALTDLENTGAAIKSNSETLDLLSVHSLELEVKLVGGGCVGDAVEGTSLHGRVLALLISPQFEEGELAKELIA